MSDLNEVNRRLEEGIPPEPAEIELIVADIRRQRKLYESGGKARSVEERQAEEVTKFMKSLSPPKTELKRRPL